MGSCVSANDIEDRLEILAKRDGNRGNPKLSTPSFYMCYVRADKPKMILQKTITSALVAEIGKAYAKKCWLDWFGLDDDLLSECYYDSMKKLTTSSIEQMIRNHYARFLDDTAELRVGKYVKSVRYDDYSGMVYKEMMHGYERLTFPCDLAMDALLRWANKVTQRLIDQFTAECKEKDDLAKAEKRKYDLYWAEIDSWRKERIQRSEQYRKQEAVAPRVDTPTTSNYSCDTYEISSNTYTYHAPTPAPSSTYETSSYQTSYPTTYSEGSGWINPASSAGTYMGGDPYSSSSYNWDEYNKNCTTILSI